MSEFWRPTPFVDVAVVLWRSAPYLERLFEGLAALDYSRQKIAVHFVDNGPGDGSLDEVKRQMDKRAGLLPQIILHEPGENTGFCGGNNLVIHHSIESGHEYTYFLNHDASFEPGALREAVNTAEGDSSIGSVQSLMVLEQNPEEVNSRGNAIHFFGFGYCEGYHEKRRAQSSEVRRIAYGSGAATLHRNRVLKETGALDETLFIYHEDLDLGWRILLAGYKNVIEPKSVVRHRYEFSRSIAKWHWMERNRWLVMLKNYDWKTLFLLFPQLLAIDIMVFSFAITGGWWRDKLRASKFLFTRACWSYLLRSREKIKRIRRVPDAAVLEAFTPYISHQEIESPFIRRVANPLLAVSFKMLKAIVRW